jgi:hypothetical protein
MSTKEFLHNSEAADEIKSCECDFSENYEAYVLSYRDPTIFFHFSGGATFTPVVKNYRLEDVDNVGNAVLMEYKINDSSHAFPKQVRAFFNVYNFINP